MNDKILEPLKYYEEELKEKHKINTEAYFEDLVKRSGVDVEGNRELMKKYHSKIDEINNFLEKLKKFGTYKGLSIFGICLGAIALIYGIVAISQRMMRTNVASLISVGGVIVAAIAIYLLVSTINPRIKDFDKSKSSLEAQAANIQNEGYTQLGPLNVLYDSDDARQLISKTFPDVILDKNFDMNRFEYLEGKYGLGDNDDTNVSSLKIMSGEIVGNPYVVVKTLSHRLGNYTYTGSIVIHWETTYRDSDGNIRTQHHSETLTASVTKPKPYYNIYTTLIYGNEAAPSLSFSRAPGHVEKLKERDYERFLREGSKNIQKLANQAITNGGTFTPLGNDEFDTVFNALNRDNETEFRLLFTPLAQQNLLKIMKNGPYGDDFYFEKKKKINYITAENSATWDLNTWCERFYNFDIDDAKLKFSTFHEQYFEHLYFELAPLLSIPLYHQQKPSEYIYKHEYKRNYTSYVSEVLANILGDQSFAPEAAKTQSILKTKYETSDGKTDSVEVKAYAYDTLNHVDYISVYGGDGRWHDVPVEWVEYIPIEKTSKMKIKDIGENDQFYLGIKNEGKFGDYLVKHNASSYAYDNGMFAMKVKNNQVDGSDKDLDDLISAIKQLINKEEK